MKNKVLYLVSMAILGVSSVKAQLNVGSTSAADASAILQATSTTKGFLPPVMTTTQRNAIVTPAPGLLIFNSTTNQQEVNSGTTGAPIWGANTAATFYNADGTLATNRVVTQGVNTLSYLGTGGIKFKSGSVNFDSSTLIGKGDSLSGGVIGIGITTNGGLNMGQNTTGNNIYIGYNSGKLNTTGFGNVFTGAYSGPSNTSGVGNTFYGYGTGQYNTTGSNNTFTGYSSGEYNTTGNYNTFSGQQSGQTNTTGASNTFTGFQSGLSNTAGGNTFTGYQSGLNNTTGSFHTFNGYQSGLNNTTGGYNTFSGYQSGLSNTTGYSNVFTGYQSGMSNTAGTQNIFYGTNTGRLNTTGSNNTFNGMNSGYSNTTGNNNTFSGINSGQANTTADNNTFTGYQAGVVNTTGVNNVFSGLNSGNGNTTGQNNVFTGTNTGQNNTTGSNNTAIGFGAGFATGALTNTTSIGYNTQATQSNTVILGTSANVGIGTTTPATKLQVVSADNSTSTNIIDVQTNNLQAGTSLWYGGVRMTGSNNNVNLSLDGKGSGGVFINAQYGTGGVGIGTINPAATLDVNGALVVRNGNYQNNNSLSQISFGFQGSSLYRHQISTRHDPNVDAYQSLDFYLWSATQAPTDLGNNFVMTMNTNGVGIGTKFPTEKLQVIGNIRSSGNVYASSQTLTSDRRLKKNIVPLNSALAKVMQLMPYSYDKKASLTATNYDQKEMGFIAQDIQKIFPELVKEDKDSAKLLSVNYTALIPLLTKAIQEQQAQNDTQVAQIAVLTKANTNMAAQLADLKDMKIAMAAMQSELSKIALVNKQAASNTASK